MCHSLYLALLYNSFLSNSFYLDRDLIIPEMLHISLADFPRLTNFEDYVKNDGIFPDSVSNVETPFGEMMKLDPTNDSGKNSSFYGRHIRDQSYLIQLSLSKTNLEIGKVPIIDCITMRQIQVL